MSSPLSSDLRVEKARTPAVVTLTAGPPVVGCFFVAQTGATSPGPERVADLLNSEPGFFPFELSGGDAPRVVLYNRDHVVTVAVPDDEARRDSGYELATTRTVSVRLNDGRELVGSVRVYRPYGRDRLSDWARDGERFRYLEAVGTTFIVNVDHVIEIRELVEP
jgi:hypothetical protein